MDFNNIFGLLLPSILICTFFFLKYQIIKYKYNKSAYKKETKIKFKKIFKDKGMFGEYLSFEKLASLPGYKKIVANSYIPKRNGQTTEIDLILIHETGIYVIESKNFSGWIFGNSKNRYWTQTLGKGRKNKFYSPIFQNQNHIKHLREYLKDYNGVYYSIIAFSERCELKKIDNSSNSKVIKRNEMENTLESMIKKNDNCLSKEEIDKIYEYLKESTDISEQKKQEHIENIKEWSV